MKGIGNTVWNGGDVNIYQSSNRRTSLVPAPAVIPAPEVYFKVVAVKTFVVYLRAKQGVRQLIGQGCVTIYMHFEVDLPDFGFVLLV